MAARFQDVVDAGYQPAPGMPVTSYAGLSAVYAAGVAGVTLLARAQGRQLPTRVPAADIATLGVATYKLSRLATREKVTGWLRAPFTRFRSEAAGPEVNESPRGEGPRRAVGELFNCPFCAAHWFATGLMAAYLFNPRLARYVASGLTALTVSDGMQYLQTLADQSVAH